MRKAIIDALATRRDEGRHPGLVLQRYLTKPVTGKNGDPEERRKLLGAAIKAARNESLRAIYDVAYDRWNASFPKNALHLTEQLQTTGRLIVGLGSENVLETGLRLHHTYGVPLIPGSALKGVAAHYCHEIWGQRHLPSSDENNRQFRRGEKGHSLLFGTTADGGVVTFHDAWITPGSLSDGALRLDVMTPHHPDWQAKKVPPTDFDNPRPVTFLSVSGTFQVRLSWCGPVQTPPDRAQAWIRLAMDLLREALAERGIGGKTSSGYGRLVAADRLASNPLLSKSAPTMAKAQPQNIPRPGEHVKAILLEEKTKKGGWKAKHEPSGLDGPIQNSADLPPDNRPGDTLVLTVASASPREIAFRYPSKAGEERAGQPRSTPAGDPKGRSPQRRK